MSKKTVLIIHVLRDTGQRSEMERSLNGNQHNKARDRRDASGEGNWSVIRERGHKEGSSNIKKGWTTIFIRNNKIKGYALAVEETG